MKKLLIAIVLAASIATSQAKTNAVTGQQEDMSWLQFSKLIAHNNTALTRFVTGLQLDTIGVVPGTGVSDWITTPTSANFLLAITNETGTGLVVGNTSPTLVTPLLGTPTSGVLTNCTGLPQAGTVGLTTSDSPQFAGVNIGAATDTTITRVSAGVIAVEGVNVVTTATTDTLSNKTLVAPALGVATATSVTTTGLIKSSGTAGIGYATGAGGTVTQGTSRTTTVVLSKTSGQITTTADSMAAQTPTTFTVTNTLVAATDVIIISKVSGDVDTFAWVNSVGAGSYTITLFNTHASAADTTATVLNVVVIKGVTS